MTRRKDSSSDEDEPESMKKDDAEELLGNAKQRQSFYADQEPIQMKTIDQIKKDAMVSFQLTKDRLKIQHEAEKYGQLRPICVEIIQEVKEQEEKRLAERRRRKLGIAESNKASWSPAPNLESGTHTKSTVTVDAESEHSQKLFRVIRRHDLLPTKMTAQFSIQNMPTSIGINEEEGNIEPNELCDREIHGRMILDGDLRRPSSASAAIRSDSDSIIFRAEATSSWDNEVAPRPYSARASLHKTASFDSGDLSRKGLVRPPLTKHSTPLIPTRSGSQILVPQQSNPTAGTSGFMAKVIEQDEKIAKALRVKEELLHAKEERILKRIQDKEESAHNRHIQQLVQERMKAWASLVGLLSRMK